jgi:hypothetical protein
VATVRASATFIGFAESKHGDGWSGPTPASPDEEQHAVNLRKLLSSTQQSRIPPEVAEIEAELEGLKKIAGRVRTLDRIAPIDPKQNPHAGAAFEAEMAELQQAASAAAEVA